MTYQKELTYWSIVSIVLNNKLCYILFLSFLWFVQNMTNILFFDCLELLTSNDVTKQCLKSRLCSVRVSCVKFPMKTKIPSEVLPHLSFLQWILCISSQYCIFVEKMPRYIVIVYSQSFPKEICLRLVTFVILEILQNWFMCTSYCAVIITKNLFIRIHSLAPKFLLMYRSTD